MINQMVCIQPGNNIAWENKGCKTVITENQDGTVSTKCQCEKVTVTTLVNDVGGVYNKLEENLEKVFSK